MQKKILFLSICLGLLAVACNCDAVYECPAESDCFVVLIDFSSSARAMESRTNYVANFPKIARQLDECDVIYATPITNQSLMETKKIVEHTFGFFTPQHPDNSTYVAKERKKFESDIAQVRDQLVTQFSTKVSDTTNHVNGTEIMAALIAASSYFKKNSGKNAQLYLMSDMLESSSFYNFETLRLSEQKSNEIIQAERDQKGLPELTGVHVHIAGAAASDTERWLGVKNFWLKYFAACSANLKTENYGSEFIQ